MSVSFNHTTADDQSAIHKTGVRIQCCVKCVMMNVNFFYFQSFQFQNAAERQWLKQLRDHDNCLKKKKSEPIKASDIT